MEPIPAFSVVVPFYNEVAAAGPVVAELGAALDGLGLDWEAVLVDDGSEDGTAGELERAAAPQPRCRVLRLPRNLGQGPALYAGLGQTRGPIVGMMDGDGQNVPSDFGVLLPLLAGADMAVGIRRDRHDTALRRRISRFANAVRGRLVRDRLSDAGCALKVFRREVIAAFRPLPMLNPFMPALAVASGYRVVEHPVRHRLRENGRSKYGLRAMAFRPVADLARVWWLIHFGLRGTAGGIARTRPEDRDQARAGGPPAPG